LTAILSGPKPLERFLELIASAKKHRATINFEQNDGLGRGLAEIAAEKGILDPVLRACCEFNSDPATPAQHNFKQITDVLPKDILALCPKTAKLAAGRRYDDALKTAKSTQHKEKHSDGDASNSFGQKDSTSACAKGNILKGYAKSDVLPGQTINSILKATSSKTHITEEWIE
jgi:hypothetical protein